MFYLYVYDPSDNSAYLMDESCKWSGWLDYDKDISVEEVVKNPLLLAIKVPNSIGIAERVQEMNKKDNCLCQLYNNTTPISFEKYKELHPEDFIGKII